MTNARQPLRIGYAAYSRDFSRPGDRRRFAAYARLRGLPIEYARPDRDYDIVFVTCLSDLPGWLERKRRSGGRLKLVFELIDSYLTQTNLAQRLLKGVGRRVIGPDTRLAPDYLATLRAACREADAVLCSTEEQQRMIAPLNPHVFVSFDYFDDETTTAKQDFAVGERLRLVWEGQAATLGGLTTIGGVLNRLADRVSLTVVTDPVAPRRFGRPGVVPIEQLLPRLNCPLQILPWERDSFADHIASADAAIIPMDLREPMIAGKPENKLVMLWKLGIPTLAGGTPAYLRAMRAAGVDMVCATDADWVAGLDRIDRMAEPERAALGHRLKAHADGQYSAKRFMAPFDRALAACGLSL